MVERKPLTKKEIPTRINVLYPVFSPNMVNSFKNHGDVTSQEDN